MEAAAKAAQEEARKKAAERNKKSADKAPVPASTAPTALRQTVDAAPLANTLFGNTTAAEPAGTTKTTGGDSLCRLAL